MALNLLAPVIFTIDALLVHVNRFSYPHEIYLLVIYTLLHQRIINKLVRYFSKIGIFALRAFRKALDHSDEKEVINWINPKPGTRRAPPVIATIAIFRFVRFCTHDDANI